MKRLTIRLPDRLYRRLLFDARRSRITVSQLIRARLEGNPKDPLLKVAGICRRPLLSKGIDENLYGL